MASSSQPHTLNLSSDTCPIQGKKSDFPPCEHRSYPATLLISQPVSHLFAYLIEAPTCPSFHQISMHNIQFLGTTYEMSWPITSILRFPEAQIPLSVLLSHLLWIIPTMSPSCLDNSSPTSYVGSTNDSRSPVINGSSTLKERPISNLISKLI